MRIAIAAFVSFGVVWFMAEPAMAAPSPLAAPPAHVVSKNVDSMVMPAAKRTRKTVRRSTRKCGWQCKSYYRPFQYRYWKFYYPFGGPLFTSRR